MLDSLRSRRALCLATFAALALSPDSYPQNTSAASAIPNAAPAQQRSVPGSNGQTPMVTVPEDFATLTLGPGYLLNVQVYDEPDLSGATRVDTEGNISLPFLGTIHVTGQTLPQTQMAIEQKFKDKGILKNPQVTINIEQFATRSATVLGEVENPGRVELLAPHNLLDVIGLAGGETALAGNEVEVKHAEAAGAKQAVYHYSRNSDGDSIRHVMVQPGDTVIVKRAGIVYVLGAVNRPGGYAMQEDGELNVAQAISLAQGLAMQAKTSGLRVVKHGADGQLVEVSVPYNKMMDGKEAPLNLAAGDIVYVPVSKVKAVFSTGSSLIGQTTAATIYTAR